MSEPFEYKVIPAPSRGQRGKGVKGAEARFAHALEIVMNDMAAEGWEYQRAETLPSEERSGLTGTTTTFRNVLVFRRPRASDVAPFQPRLLEADTENDAPRALPAGDVSAQAPEAGAGEDTAAEARSGDHDPGTDNRSGEAPAPQVSDALRRRADQVRRGAEGVENPAPAGSGARETREG